MLRRLRRSVLGGASTLPAQDPATGGPPLGRPQGIVAGNFPAKLAEPLRAHP